MCPNKTWQCAILTKASLAIVAAEVLNLFTKPKIIFNRVVFPLPLGPNIEIISPSSISIDMLFKTLTPS